MAAVYVMRHRRTFAQQLHPVLGTRSFGMLFAGMVLVMVVSRLIGHQEAWQAALGEMYLRDIPRTIEEAGELIGYLILALGSIEAWFEADGADTGDAVLRARARGATPLRSSL